MSFSDIFAHTVVISRKTVKSGKNTFCDICAQNSRRYEFCDLFTHTVRISRKMVRSHRNSICDTCVQISRSYEFFDIFAYIVVISSKTVKSAKNVIFDFCATNIEKNMSFCDHFRSLLQLYEQKCRKTHISTSFVHKCHKSCS